MRIAHFASGYPVLSETFVRDEIAAFAAEGFSNIVVSLRPADRKSAETLPALDPALRIDTALYPKLSLAGLLNPFDGPVTLPKSLRVPGEALRNLYLRTILPSLVESLARAGVDHCHAHFAHYPATLAWMCASRLGVGFSFNAHSYDLFRYRSFLSEKVQGADFVFPISERNRAHLLEFSGRADGAASRIRVFHCGIDLDNHPFEPPDPSPSGPPKIVAVGRLVDTKGFDTLLDALPEVARQFPDLKVEIVGEGPERPNLTRQAERLGIEGCVTFRGALDREATRAVQRGADVAVQPCRAGFEGLDGIPVVLMEAMALGVPVVSTRFEAIPELIEDGVSGLLVPPGDPKALAAAILEMFGGARDLAALTHAAREIVEKGFAGPRNYRDKAALVRSLLAAPEGASTREDRCPGAPSPLS